MNFSGVKVCVIAPVCVPSLDESRLAVELDELLKKQGAIVLSPNGFAIGDDRTDSLCRLFDAISVSRVLLLLPKWGNCTFARAAWAAAQYLQISVLFVDRDVDGSLIVPSDNAVVNSNSHRHVSQIAAQASGVPQ